MTPPVICADSDDAYDDDDHKDGDVVRDDDGDSDLMSVTLNAIAMFFSLRLLLLLQDCHS